MPNYHISEKTHRPNICKAEKRECPLGADTPHFTNKSEAQAYAEKTYKSTEKKTLSKKNTVPVAPVVDHNADVHTMSKEECHEASMKIMMGIIKNQQERKDLEFDLKFDAYRGPKEEAEQRVAFLEEEMTSYKIRQAVIDQRLWNLGK